MHTHTYCIYKYITYTFIQTCTHTCAHRHTCAHITYTHTHKCTHHITKGDQSWSFIVTEGNKDQKESHTGEEQGGKHKNPMDLKPSTIGHCWLHMASHRNPQISKYWPCQYHKYTCKIKSHNYLYNAIFVA